jgi:hypothetical protein
LRRPAYELVFALVAVIAITIWYVSTTRDSIPQPGGGVGHGLGIVGFLLMLSTETLYSYRKRVQRWAIGPSSVWLQAHVFTGIVGPYLVLLHSAGKFNGLAGMLTCLTVVMVLSGFVGRYIYTAVPRTFDGIELTDRDLGMKIAQADRQLRELGAGVRELKALTLATNLKQRGWTLVLARPWIRWRQRRRLLRAVRDLSPEARARAGHLHQLLEERSRLQMQVHSLAAARRLLALWYLLHVPLGGVLFTLAFIHIGAALYYATFLR